MAVGAEPGQAGSPAYLLAGRHLTRSHYEAVADVKTGFNVGDRIQIRRHSYLVVGITQRMVAYYEAPGAQPPAHLLQQMAQVLGVGADVLLGMAQPRKVKRLATNSLERRLLEIEKLDPKAKRQITQLLDTFIEREKLEQRVDSQTRAQRNPTTQGA